MRRLDDVVAVIAGTGADDATGLNRDEVIGSLRTRHAVLFRGFRMDADRFCALTEYLGTSFRDYRAGAYDRERIGGKETLLSVTGHADRRGVPMHGEMHYKKDPPELLWFYCEAPPTRGGETLVCDGADVFDAMPGRARSAFLSRRVRYERTYTEDRWPQIFQTESLEEARAVCLRDGLTFHSDGGGVTTTYTCPAVVDSRDGARKVFINNVLTIAVQERLGMKGSTVRFEDGAKIPALTILPLLFRSSRRLGAPVAWQKGDVLLVDNTRMMHGRRRYGPGDRKIYVRMSAASFAL